MVASPNPPDPGGLTPDEQQVLELALAGETNKAIAHRIGVGVRTIERRRAAALHRLGVGTLVEAARVLDREHRHGTFDTAFSLAAPAALFDRRGRFVAVNPALCETLGKTEAEFLRLPQADLTHPDDRAAEQDRVRRLFSGESDGYRTEKRMRTAGGAFLRLRFAVCPVWGDDGTPIFGLAQLLRFEAN